MVFGVPFQCDMCNTAIMLKIQADNSLYSHKYPISLICPRCGNLMNFSYNRSKGILPMDYKAEENVKTDFDLYYSASLPIVEDLHLKPSETIVLTPYLSLGRYYDSPKIAEHNRRENMFLNNIYPYRKVFQEVLPIYRKGNVSAYSKKIIKIFNFSKNYTPISDIKECRTHLFELLQSTYNNLATEEYLKNVADPFFRETIDINHIDVLKQTNLSVSDIMNYNQWQKKAFDFIGDMVAKFEKYMPSLFYCSVGDFSERHEPATNIYTISVDEVIGDYDRSFHLIKELLTLIVALSNFKITGDINVFPNISGGMKGIGGIEAFHKLSDGLKFDKLQDYHVVKNYLAGGYNVKIRNGIGHKRWNVASGTQLIQFKHKQNDDSAYGIQLVDLGYLVIINLLHIMEFALFIEELKKV